MSRDDGFTVADVSSGLLDDDRMRALWRRLGNQADMCEACTAHEAVLLASWRHGKRMTVTQASPLWLAVRSEIVDALMAVGLLDRSQRIPAKTWTTWFGAANVRREARRAAGSKGGRTPRKQPASNASASLNPTGRQAGPSVPSVPTDPSSPRGGTRAQSANGRPEKVGSLLRPFEEMVGGKAS